MGGRPRWTGVRRGRATCEPSKWVTIQAARVPGAVGRSMMTMTTIDDWSLS